MGFQQNLAFKIEFMTEFLLLLTGRKKFQKKMSGKVSASVYY